MIGWLFGLLRMFQVAADNNLTEAEVEAYARANANIQPLMALEFRHSQWLGPVRLVDGDVDRDLLLPVDAALDSGEVVAFQGVQLNVPEEQLDDEPDSQLQVQVAGVAGAVHEYFSVAAKSFESAQVSQYRVSVNLVTGEVLSVVRQAEIEVRSFHTSMTSVTLGCGYTNTSNRELKV